MIMDCQDCLNCFKPESFFLDRNDREFASGQKDYEVSSRLDFLHTIFLQTTETLWKATCINLYSCLYEKL